MTMDDDDDVSTSLSLSPVWDRSPLNAQDLGEDSGDDPLSTMYGGGRGRR